jgi:hypothetical protein
MLLTRRLSLRSNLHHPELQFSFLFPLQSTSKAHSIGTMSLCLVVFLRLDCPSHNPQQPCTPDSGSGGAKYTFYLPSEDPITNNVL